MFIILLKMEQVMVRKYQIKSKYLNQWQTRTVVINFNNNVLGISQHGAHLFKYFNLTQLRIQQKSKNLVVVHANSGRKYQLMGNDVTELIDVINSHHILKQLTLKTQTNLFSSPKNINYSSYLQTTEQKVQKFPQMLFFENKKQQQLSYKKMKSYRKQEDWVNDEQEGGLVLINPYKKKNQGKIIKFVLTKFITTGSFMGISFPVFAMKSQSILETYCKSIAAAPVIFASIPKDHVQRIKKFICFCFTFSKLFTDMDKPFNPTIGQTFQAQIMGCSYSAQQISHHPPKSSIYFEGKGYIIHATLELVASIGLRSATGMIQGDIIIEFEDGHKLIGRSFEGEMSGFVFGENRFRPVGSSYAYDPVNKIICSYARDQKDIFKGYIGVLDKRSQIKFDQLLKKKQRFTQFESFEKHNFCQILSRMQASWCHRVKFDNVKYIDFDDPQWLPFQPSFDGIQLLDSDSRHRKDIQQRARGNIEEAQQQKERIQQQQRNWTKLRSNYGKKNSHHKMQC